MIKILLGVFVLYLIVDKAKKKHNTKWWSTSSYI